ncbi:MAG: SDR family NAD(P)-dependent oxidoreductase, partial [Solirubrobacteraceae bacterium]
MPLPPPGDEVTCLVTGASSGIGAELARVLAGRGLGLTLVARREERLRELADEIAERSGVRAEVVAADVSAARGRKRLIAALEERGLAVEVLINNAGFGSGGPFTTLDAAREASMVRTNVEAVVALTGHYLPQMAERGRGAVLNVASLIAFQPVPFQATYGASKAFVLSFTDALHEEMRGTGVTVTAVCPGPVRTEFGAQGGFGGADERIPDPLWLSAGKVARDAVAALERGDRVSVPGPGNQLAALWGRHLPRSVLLPLLRRL